MIDLIEWASQARRRFGAAAERWLQRLQVEMSTISVAALLKFCMSHYKVARSLFWQLVAFVAVHFDSTVRDQLRSESHCAIVPRLQVADKMATSAALRGQQLEAFLGRLLHASQTFCRDATPWRFVYIATDKSHVGGLPLQSTFLGVGGQNVVLQCLPQVACVCGFFRRRQKKNVPFSYLR